MNPYKWGMNGFPLSGCARCCAVLWKKQSPVPVVRIIHYRRGRVTSHFHSRLIDSSSCARFFVHVFPLSFIIILSFFLFLSCMEYESCAAKIYFYLLEPSFYFICFFPFYEEAFSCANVISFQTFPVFIWCVFTVGLFSNFILTTSKRRWTQTV